jgi:hypothetical protein
MTALLHAHSGVRYLVLLAALVALLYFAYGVAARRAIDKAGRVINSIFVGLLDLQVLLGIALLAVYAANGRFYGALIGHIVVMLAAVAVAHGASVLAKSRGDARQQYSVRLVGVVITLILIALGVAAIGRPLIGAGAGPLA